MTVYAYKVLLFVALLVGLLLAAWRRFCGKDDT